MKIYIYFFQVLIIAAFLASCSAPRPETRVLPDNWTLAGGQKLVSARRLGLKTGAELGTVLDWASTGFLKGRIGTGMLEKMGYEKWRIARARGLADVEVFQVVFDTSLLPGGPPDRQSGLLLLPAALYHTKRSLTWVCWNRGTELLRVNAPSRQAGSETLFATVLAGLGFAVWMPDYAGLGESPGVQTYCVPESQALSMADGLSACREVLAHLSPQRTESGRLFIMGYSQGGLSAMAGARLLASEPQRIPGLQLKRVWALGAPFDLMIGAGSNADPDRVLERPEYTVYLVLGWARAYPGLIKPADILKDNILRETAVLFDGHHDNGPLHEAIARAAGKPVGKVTYRDLFVPSYLDSIRKQPETVPYFQAQKNARLDRWVPPDGLGLVLAASDLDRVVNPENSRSAYRYIRSQKPEADLVYLELLSESHPAAGAESLLAGIMMMDRGDGCDVQR